MELSKRQAEIIFSAFLGSIIILALCFQKLDDQGLITTIIGDGIMAGLVYLLFTRSQVVKDVIEALVTFNKREKQRRLILDDIKQWSSGVKANLIYAHGSLTYNKMNVPDSPHYPETKKIFEEREIYDLRLKGIEESNKLVDDGKKEIDKFESLICNALKDILLKVSLTVNTLPEPSYCMPMARESIYDGIMNDKNINLKISGRFLNDGTKKIAEGDLGELKKLESRIKELINNKDLRDKIQTFNEIKKKVEDGESLKDFYVKRDELIREYEYNIENVFHRND
jgi:hypothetical protein